MATDYGEIFKQLVCQICKSYISGGNLKVDNVGNTLCENCEAVSKCKTIPMFELLLKNILFPCNYASNGCQELLLGNTGKDHEAKCQHKRYTGRHPFQTISLDLLNALKCSVCNNYLNVPPIRVSNYDDYICGRCPDVYIDEAPTRHKLFEDVAKLIKYPCINAGQGCKTLLLWEQVEDHEYCCNFRTVNCPISQQKDCEWIGTSREIISHFRMEHPEHLLEANSCAIKFSESKEIRKMFLHNNQAFLLSVVVNTQKNALSLNVLLIDKCESSDTANHDYLYSVKFSVNAISYEPFQLKPVAVNATENISECKEQSALSLEKLTTIFEDVDVLKCSVAITIAESQREDTESFSIVEKCSKGCDHVGSEDDIKSHEENCPNKVIWCRFNCEIRLPKDRMLQHEASCAKRRVACKWLCGAKFLHKNIANHEENCLKSDNLIIATLRKELEDMSNQIKDTPANKVRELEEMLKKECDKNAKLKKQLTNRSETTRFDQEERKMKDQIKNLETEKEIISKKMKNLEKQLLDKKGNADDIVQPVQNDKEKQKMELLQKSVLDLQEKLDTSKRLVSYLNSLNKHGDGRKFKCFSNCPSSNTSRNAPSYLVINLLVHLKEFHKILVPFANQINVSTNFDNYTRRDEWFSNFCIYSGELFKVCSMIREDDQLECYAVLYGPDQLAEKFKYEVYFSEDNVEKLVGYRQCDRYHFHENKITINARNHLRNVIQLGIKVVLRQHLTQYTAQPPSVLSGFNQNAKKLPPLMRYGKYNNK